MIEKMNAAPVDALSKTNARIHRPQSRGGSIVVNVNGRDPAPPMTSTRRANFQNDSTVLWAGTEGRQTIEVDSQARRDGDTHA